MPSIERITRQQLLREAEGCLDLATACDGLWSLSPDVRDRLCGRAMRLLDEVTGRSELGFVHLLRGRAFRVQERWPEAIESFEEAAKFDSENLRLQLALGWCYKRIDRLDLAIQALEIGLAIDPDAAILHYNLACYWSLARNPALALQYLAQALEIDPDFREMTAEEPDFDNIRRHPDFLMLTSVIV